MNEFLTSLKADLTDRRLLPLVALVGVCLIAAIAYATLGSGGSSTLSSPAVAPAPATSGISVSSVKSETAVAETTDGVSEQHTGKARNPFLALPGATATTAKTGAASSSGSSSSGSSGSGSSTSSGSGGSSSSGTSTSGSGSGSGGSSPSKKAKPKQLYAVTIKFGPVAAVTESSPLPEYANLKLNAPLPSVKQPLIVFRGVTSKGASASFTLVSEAILHGVGACLPSATQCQALDLHPGASEQLEYLQENGEVQVYELKVLSIEQIKANAAAAKRATEFAQSQIGTALLKHENLIAIPYLHYSSQPGVLAFSWHKAFASRAHASQHARSR